MCNYCRPTIYKYNSKKKNTLEQVWVTCFPLYHRMINISALAIEELASKPVWYNPWLATGSRDLAVLCLELTSALG